MIYLGLFLVVLVFMAGYEVGSAVGYEDGFTDGVTWNRDRWTTGYRPAPTTTECVQEPAGPIDKRGET